MEMQNGAATLKNNLAAQDVKHSYHMTKQFHSYVYTPKSWKQVHKKQNCTAVPQITVSLNVISPLIRKKLIPTRATVCVVCLVSPCSVWAFSGFSGFRPYSKDVHIGWICVGWISVSNLSQSECMKGILFRAAPTLSCWDRLRPPDTLNWNKCVGK